MHVVINRYKCIIAKQADIISLSTINICQSAYVCVSMHAHKYVLYMPDAALNV